MPERLLAFRNYLTNDLFQDLFPGKFIFRKQSDVSVSGLDPFFISGLLNFFYICTF